MSDSKEGAGDGASDDGAAAGSGPAPIVLKNLGPIRYAEIPTLPDGGIVVLRGRNEVGKSTALDAIEALVVGPTAGVLEPTAGVVTGGSAEGFGVKISATSSGTRRKGSESLEVTGLEGDIDLTDLIDGGGFKDAATADARRILTGCKLARVSAAAAVPRFAKHLQGGLAELTRLVKPAALAKTDVVEMAKGIRSDLNDAALAAERAADAGEGRASGLRQQAGEVDPAAVTDAATLHAAVEAATRNEARLQGLASAAEQAQAQAAQARARLVAAETRTDVPTVAAAETALDEADAEIGARTIAVTDAADALAKAQAALAEAKSAHGQAVAAHRNAGTMLTAARQHADNLAGWRRTVDEASSVAGPTADDMAAAALAVEKARQAADAGAVARRAREQIDEADRVADAAALERAHGERLRAAAKATDDVLSDMLATVAPDNWRIEDGRIIVKEGAQEFFFGRLSNGARACQAVDLALRSVGERPADAPPVIMVLHQNVWEGIDADAEQVLRAHCLQRRVTLYAAAADKGATGELRAEVLAEREVKAFDRPATGAQPEE